MLTVLFATRNGARRWLRVLDAFTGLQPPRGRHRLAGAPLWAWLRLTLRVYARCLCGQSLQERFALEYERAEWAG